MPTSPGMNYILIYDGHCGLCHRAVRHILRNDRPGTFRFAASTTPTGRRLLAEAGFETPPESMVLIAGGRVYTHSSAALEIARGLGGIHRLAMPFRLVPRPLRDRLYKLVARTRYRFFGRFETCQLPGSQEQGRFLDAGEAATLPMPEMTTTAGPSA